MLLLATALPGAASASAICDGLNARLAELPRASGAAGNTRVYSNAISRQTIQMRKVRADMRRFGCSSGSVIVYGNVNDDTCGMLADTMDRMQDNLDMLDRKRRDTAMAAGDASERRRLRNALKTHGCVEQPDGVQEAAIGEKKIHRNILRDLPPAGESIPMLRDSLDESGLSLMDPALDGSLRTVCVRMCDGAFFPISANASPSNFARDTAMCSSRCPGTPTELYYHALQTEETEDMVSAATGRPYRDLPNAFAYRTRDLDKPAACGCGMSALEKRQSTPDRTAGRQSGTGSITTFTSRTPDTGDTTGAIKTEPEERPYDPKAKVRIVGPTYLPGEESAIDLRNPAN